MSELHSAVASSNLHAVKQLLSENNLDVNARDYSGALAFAPLHVAARRGDVKVIRALIADARVDIEAKDATKCTALRHAMGTGQLAAATELLVAGADAKNGLLPFIMLDGYNHLVAFLNKTIAELEAQVRPHRALRRNLARLLHKLNALPPATQQLQRQQQQLNQAGHQVENAHHAEQQLASQQQCQRLGSLTGVQRDAAELEGAAVAIKKLRAELARLSQPISPAMCCAIVCLAKACREREACTDDGAAAAAGGGNAATA